MDIGFAPFEAGLRSGRIVRVRAVRPTDDEEILQAFDRLSEEARYRRFMGTVRAVNPRRLREILATFPGQGVAIVATVPAADGIDIVGMASYRVDPQPQDCEFAITIADEWAGEGLGRTLLSTLIASARSNGLAQMRGFVLASNGPMLRLAGRLGFAIAVQPEDYSTRICTLALYGEEGGEGKSPPAISVPAAGVPECPRISKNPGGTV